MRVEVKEGLIDKFYDGFKIRGYLGTELDIKISRHHREKHGEIRKIKPHQAKALLEALVKKGEVTVRNKDFNEVLKLKNEKEGYFLCVGHRKSVDGSSGNCIGWLNGEKLEKDHIEWFKKWLRLFVAFSYAGLKMHRETKLYAGINDEIEEDEF